MIDTLLKDEPTRLQEFVSLSSRRKTIMMFLFGRVTCFWNPQITTSEWRCTFLSHLSKTCTAVIVCMVDIGKHRPFHSCFVCNFSYADIMLADSTPKRIQSLYLPWLNDLWVLMYKSFDPLNESQWGIS